MMWQDIAYWGKKLASSGLVSSRFGNISVRTKDGLMIKRTGVMLDSIESADDVIDISLYTSRDDSIASTETPSHRAIYLATDAKAIIHAHPQFAVVESLLCKNEILPLDTEGIPFLGTIPIVDGDTGTQELCDNLARAYSKSAHPKGVKGVVNRGHGSFAAGPDLKDCFNTTAMIEHSSKVKYLFDLARR